MYWYYAAAIAVIAFAVYILRKDYRASASQLSALSAAEPISPDREQEIRTALYEHAVAIEAFVERSSHPRELFDNPDFKKAVSLLSSPDIPAEILRQHAMGLNWQISCAALHVLTKKTDPQLTSEQLVARLHQMRPWNIYFVLMYLGSMETPPPVGLPFVKAQYWWLETPWIAEFFREYLDHQQRRGSRASFENALDEAQRTEIQYVEGLLDGISHPYAVQLRSELKAWKEHRLDREFLTTVGRFWEADKNDDLLILPVQWTSRMTDAMSAVLRAPRHSLVVVGDPRIGKTAFLKLLGREIKREGWLIFEASAAELMAGQMYVGQLEERIRRIIAELNVARKVVWYVPDLLQLAQSGTHQGQSASILDQVFSAIGTGSLVIVAEASPSGLSQLFLQRPSMRSSLEICRLDSMTEKDTAEIVQEVAKRITDSGAVSVSSDAVETVLHLSHQYLGTSHLPGLAIDLLKRAVRHTISANRGDVASEDVLDTLSQLSGLPRAILDDDQRLDLDVVRREFDTRVIGQDEAVNAIVDRIAMLKAGLVDPRRPIGVFLFAGPTGTGKTELAKTLAAYLFGSTERMARLDMSEFQTPDSVTKIIGSGADSESLTDKVRKQPFAVILLDEFEKAHPNVWDLFLQVFDDGRLTDAQGRLVNFNHSIIILTTNLGAVAHKSSTVGFGRSATSYSSDQVLQAVAQTFRPEFVNRLDKIVVFKPLSRALMRKILDRELSLVLQRRGLRQREWAVEWEESAISFLLDRGFSSDMGARPLRRAIDEYLLAPLAATMVEHRYPNGDQFLFVRSDGEQIQVVFVDPDADDATFGVEEQIAELSLAQIILSPGGEAAEQQWLLQRWAGVARHLNSEVWDRTKQELFGQVNSPDIWRRADKGSVFTRLEVVERVMEAARTGERLADRLMKLNGKSRSALRETSTRLALQTYVIEQGIQDVETAAPIDALLQVDTILDGNADNHALAAWQNRLVAMYRGWVLLRHMKLDEIGPSKHSSSVILHITGFGAYRTLKEEDGLHLLEAGEGGARYTARVKVVAGPSDTRADGLLAATELLSTGGSSEIVRRYREGPAALVRDARKGWRSGNFASVMAGNFDLIGYRRSE